MSAKDDYDDYDDEEFEAYDDDFDEPEEKEQPVSSKAASAKEIAEMERLKLAMEQENSAARASPAPAVTSYNTTSNSYGGHQQHHIPSVAASKTPPPDMAGLPPKDSKTTRDSKGHYVTEEYSNKRPPQSQKRHSGNDYTMDFSAPVMSSQTDPRMKRLNRLRGLSTGKKSDVASQTCVFDIQEESFVQLNIPPISKYDYYHRNLRQIPAQVKQVGVPQELESRDVEVGTDDIETADVSMQFSSGSDDTLLLNVVEAVRTFKRAMRKNRNEPDAEISRQLTDAICANKYSKKNTASVGTSMEADPSVDSVSQLSLFLHKTTSLFEGLLEKPQDTDLGETKSGQEHEAASTIVSVPFNTSHSLNRAPPPKQLFSSHSPQWKVLSENSAKNDPFTWIYSRPAALLKCSHLNPHLLVSVHPYGAEAKAQKEPDLKPHRSVLCVWDMLAGDSPVYVLESSGETSSVCFSAAQSYVLLGGNLDSCLDLYDLRESSSHHCTNRDSANLTGNRVIRKPCYTTNFERGSLLAKSLFADERHSSEDISGMHTGKIIQVESIGGVMDGEAGSTSVAQFASVDEYGGVLLWLTMDVYTNNILNHSSGSSSAEGTADKENTVSILSAVDDFGLAPWSTLKLTFSRRLNTGAPELNTTAGILGCPAGLMNQGAVLGLVPKESTSLFAYADSRLGSNVQKLARLGEASLPNYYGKLYCELYLENGAVEESQLISKYSAVVTSISVTSCVMSVDCDRVEASGGYSERDDGKEEEKSDRDSSVKAGDVSVSTRTGDDTKFYLLLGRSDGTVDLYDMETNFPIMTWKPVDYVMKSGRGSSVAVDYLATRDARSYSIVAVKWINHMSFVVVDCIGFIYVYDLSYHTEIPILVDSSLTELCGDISRDGQQRPLFTSSSQVDISIPYQQSVVNSNITVAVVMPVTKERKSTRNISIRRLNEKLGLVNKSTSIANLLKSAGTRVFQDGAHVNRMTFQPPVSTHSGRK